MSEGFETGHIIHTARKTLYVKSIEVALVP